MHAAISALVQFGAAFEHWVATASLDTLNLFRALVQHTTPAAVELIALVTAGAVGAAGVALWVRRRVRATKAAHVRVRRYAAAVSGLTGFQQAKAEFAATAQSGIVTATARAGETRRRVETKVMDVAPQNEQDIIDLLAYFKWYLKSSTPVKTKDTHLERRGDEIYSVTETENYVHLVFERDLDEPNIGRIKVLEREYFSIVIPSIPSFAGPVIVGILGLFTGFGIIVIWPLCLWWSMNISKRRDIAKEEIPRLRARQIEILEECDRL